ncbi:GYF domain-containing protein [Bradyrhizobium sp. USDA 4454]
MSEWYLWDGEIQRGPMDRTELDNRIRYHPNPSVVRVWREGFSDWKTAGAALVVSPRISVEPPPLDGAAKVHVGAKRQNFVARNWRGEYPLGISYWLIGVLSNLFALIVIALISALSSKAGYNPISILIFVVSLWSFIAGLAVWQSVGIWRSAQHRIEERTLIGKRAPWAGLAKVMVFIGALQTAGILIKSGIPQIAEATNMAFMDDPDIPAYSIRVMNDGSEAEITGGIKYGLAEDFRKILDSSKGVRLVHLDSIGGRIGEGEKLFTLIKSRGLDTYVDSKCLSACTFAFVAGRQRILRNGAVLGFHRGSFAGEEDLSSGRSIYETVGISAPFIDRALATKNADMWRPSQAELLAARVITKTSNGDEYAFGGFGGNGISRDDWDKALQETAVYRELKAKYRLRYDEVLDVFSNGAAKGTPRAKLFADARGKLMGLIKSLLPRADDAVLTDYGRLIVDEYRAVQLQGAAACYAFASGESDDSSVQTLPKQLSDRELEINARIISTARLRDGVLNTDAVWEKVRAGLRQRGVSASDLQLLNSKATTPTEQARFCEVTILFYQEIMNLPMKEAALILREIFS